MKKYQSSHQPNLYFWAEKNPGPVASWSVTAQVTGFPATEANDDWFANKADAEELARTLAQGELPNN